MVLHAEVVCSILVGITGISQGSLHGEEGEEVVLRTTDGLQVVFDGVTVGTALHPCDGVTVGDGTVRAVAVLIRHHRADHVDLTENLVHGVRRTEGVGTLTTACRTVVRRHRLVDVLAHEVDAPACLQLVEGVDVDVHACAHLILVVVVHDTVLIEVAYAGQVLRSVVTARERHVVLSLLTGLVEQVLPVGVGVVVRIRAILELVDLLLCESVGHAHALVHLVPHLSDAAGAHVVRIVRSTGETEESLIGHRSLTALTTLGGDEDNAVSCLRSVDGTGGSVLQHGDRLHIVRVHVVHRALETVDDHQRSRLIERTDTTDVDVTDVHTRLTGVLEYGNTWEQTCET